MFIDWRCCSCEQRLPGLRQRGRQSGDIVPKRERGKPERGPQAGDAQGSFQ